MTVTIGTGKNREEWPPLSSHRPWRPTDPPCEHLATVPIEPRVLSDGIVYLRRCLTCRAEVAR